MAGDGGRGRTKPSQDAGLSSGGGSQGQRDAALPVCGCVHIGMLVGRSTCSEGNVSAWGFSCVLEVSLGLGIKEGMGHTCT